MESSNLGPPASGDIVLSDRYIAAIAVLTVLAVSIAWLRMYTRIFVSHNPGWDDWTMFAASLVTIVTNTFLMTSYHNGIGRHIYYMTADQISQTFMWLWAAEPTNLFAVFLVRLSISLFFLRLVPPRKVYKRVIWGTIAALAAADIFISIYYFFECRPIQKVWKTEISGTCFGRRVALASTWLYQATSISSDIILLIIPACIFWRLQVELRIKLALILICCLGIFTCACAIVKTVLLPNLFSSNPDKTWIIAQLCLWAPMELCIGMICGTIPTLRPLFTSSAKRSGRPQRHYQKFEPSYELNPLENGSLKASLQAVDPTNSTDKNKDLQESPSEELDLAAQGSHQIRRTIKLEITNESLAAMDEGRSSHNGTWGVL